jgi:hypothetical protein
MKRPRTIPFRFLAAPAVFILFKLLSSKPAPDRACYTDPRPGVMVIAPIC